MSINSRIRLLFSALVGLFVLGTSSGALAERHIIKAAGIKFNPMIVYVEPGDEVVWTNMIGHNVETIDSMVPEGQEKVTSEMGSDVFETFDNVGIIVYKCTPHWSARMGGMIIVGKPENPGEIIDSYLAAIEEDRSALPAKGLLKKLRRDMEAKGLL